MSAHLTRLLGQHLRASAGAWLIAAVAVQFLITTATWALGSPREFLPGVLLLAAAATQTAPARGMVWQILPISRRDIALARWCAAVLLPALALSGALLLADLSNRSTAWPAPSTSSLLLQLAGVWSAYGYLAWLPLRTPFDASPRRTLILLSTWSIPVLIAGYGYPIGPRAGRLSMTIIAIGCALLVVSLWRARSGHLLPAAAEKLDGVRASNRARTAKSAAARWGTLTSSFQTQPAWMLTVGLATSALLRHLYPHGGVLLLWPFLIALSIWSTLSAQRWTRSLWIWRCLPLTAARAALSIQAMELLPLLITLSAVWALGSLAPHAAITMPSWLPVATVALVGMANAIARLNRRRAREADRLRYYLASCLAAAYLSFLFAVETIAHHFIWFAALMWIFAGALLAISYHGTLRELTALESVRRVEVNAPQ